MRILSLKHWQHESIRRVISTCYLEYSFYFLLNMLYTGNVPQTLCIPIVCRWIICSLYKENLQDKKTKLQTDNTRKLFVNTWDWDWDVKWSMKFSNLLSCDLRLRLGSFLTSIFFTQSHPYRTLTTSYKIQCSYSVRKYWNCFDSVWKHVIFMEQYRTNQLKTIVGSSAIVIPSPSGIPFGGISWNMFCFFIKPFLLFGCINLLLVKRSKTSRYV